MIPESLRGERPSPTEATGDLREFLGLTERWRSRQAKVEDLVRAQEAAARRLSLEDAFEKPVTAVAGVDVSFLDDRAFAAAVVLDYASAAVLEQHVALSEGLPPYLPGLLVFREGPAAVKAVRALGTPFQVLLVNAHGLAHPRRCGAASHLGLLLGISTIGVAVSLLCGSVVGTPRRAGEWLPLECNGQVVGAAGIPAPGLRPIYVSPGHRISLRSSVEIASGLLRGRRLPEPLAVAHALAVRARRS